MATSCGRRPERSRGADPRYSRSAPCRRRADSWPSATNPDHHIWNNNGTHYLHVTLRWNGETKLRLRKSLGTKDIHEARRRRDRLLVRMREQPELELLIR